MVGHCVVACHCSASTFVPVMYNPAVFSSSTSSSARSSRPARPPPSAAAPLLVPKPKPVVDDAEDSSERGCPGWVCAVGLAGLVVAAVILVILFI